MPPPPPPPPPSHFTGPQGLAAGAEYLSIDDCWCNTTAVSTPAAGYYGGCRDASGMLQPDRSRFPSGMASIAAKVHGMGLKFGMCESLRPTLPSLATLTPRYPRAEPRHPHPCAKPSVARPADTSVGDCQSNHLPSIFNFSSGAVVQSDIDQLASWGIDLLKVDSCAPHPPRDPVDMWAGFNATYPAVGQALLEAGRAHNRTILFSCSWPACESSLPPST